MTDKERKNKGLSNPYVDSLYNSHRWTC